MGTIIFSSWKCDFKPLDFSKGVKDHPTGSVRRIIFKNRVACIEVISERRVVAIDGQALAGMYHNKGRKGLIYMAVFGVVKIRFL